MGPTYCPYSDRAALRLKPGTVRSFHRSRLHPFARVRSRPTARLFQDRDLTKSRDTDTDSEVPVIDVSDSRSAITRFDELASLGAPQPWSRSLERHRPKATNALDGFLRASHASVNQACRRSVLKGVEDEAFHLYALPLMRSLRSLETAQEFALLGELANCFASSKEKLRIAPRFTAVSESGAELEYV